MFGMFSDEELQEMERWNGHFFCSFSHTPEMLNKAKVLDKVFVALLSQFVGDFSHCWNMFFSEMAINFSPFTV